ncbi:MAG: dihydrodipicolinate synthase family protein [Gaiellaceae bacterium]|jgi:1-pyrroline-4-hydroxy-2-carboxylate deaminase
MEFRGVIPAVTTPFTDELELDLPSLTTNIGQLRAARIETVCACGTMGEASALSLEERAAVISTVLDAAEAVVVGISSPSTATSVDFARQAAEFGAHGLMCLPPTTYDCDDDETVAFFRAVGAATALPLMIYNNPAAARVDMPARLIARICDEVPTAAAVKECSEDARRIAAVIEAADDRIAILVGGDDWALEGYAAGAVGWVSGVANVAPTECIQLESLCFEGRLEEARALNQRLLPLSRLDMHPKLVQLFKLAQDRVGMRGGPSRPPRLPLNEEEIAMVDAAVAVGVAA